MVLIQGVFRFVGRLGDTRWWLLFGGCVDEEMRSACCSSAGGLGHVGSHANTMSVYNHMYKFP